MAENERERADWGPLIGFFRLLKRWNQAQFARRAGFNKAQISRYEAGEDTPRPATFERIREAAGVPAPLVGFIRWFLRIVRDALAGGGAVGAPGLPAGWGEDTRDAVFRAVEQTVGLARAELELVRSRCPEPLQHFTEEDILRVEGLWQQLRNRPDASRRLLIGASSAYRDWRLCLRLCDESEKAAPADAGRALEWANLALYLSRQVPGTDGWLSRLEGYCTAFLANAWRVGNDLPASAASFSRSHRLWQAGEDPSTLLSGGRRLDLEASLCRDQRRFAEALALHDQALAVATPDETGMILLNRSFTQKEKGDHSASISTLEQASLVIDGQRQPRLLCVLRFNLASNLCLLGQAQEAADMLPQVRELAEGLGNDLDLIRTRWLEGRVDSGLGYEDKAMAALEEVRAAFQTRQLPYDYALASLDLALLYRKQERFPEIGEIAGEILTIFQAQQVHREALAAIYLFREAAGKQAVSVEMLRRLQEYLGKAQSNPKLRFAG